jgi:hypothetical protein
MTVNDAVRGQEFVFRERHIIGDLRVFVFQHRSGRRVFRHGPFPHMARSGGHPFRVKSDEKTLSSAEKKGAVKPFGIGETAAEAQ